MADRLDRAGKIAQALAALGVGLGLAYFIWPAEIAHQPLAAVPLGNLLHVIFSGAVGIVALYLAAMFAFDLGVECRGQPGSGSARRTNRLDGGPWRSGTC